MVRVRIRSHLEALIERFSDILPDVEIQEFHATDYAYRIFIDKSAWAEVLAELGKEIDYDNFKSEVAHHKGKGGADYERALHDVWSVMYRLQK